MLVSGLGDDPQKDMDKCAGHKCPMVVPGMNHHVVVLCQLSSQKLHPGQQLVDSHAARVRSRVAPGFVIMNHTQVIIANLEVWARAVPCPNSN